MVRRRYRYSYRHITKQQPKKNMQVCMHTWIAGCATSCSLRSFQKIFAEATSLESEEWASIRSRGQVGEMPALRTLIRRLDENAPIAEASGSNGPRERLLTRRVREHAWTSDGNDDAADTGDTLQIACVAPLPTSVQLSIAPADTGTVVTPWKLTPADGLFVWIMRITIIE